MERRSVLRVGGRVGGRNFFLGVGFRFGVSLRDGVVSLVNYIENMWSVGCVLLKVF